MEHHVGIDEPMLTAREALWSEFAKLHREVVGIAKEDQVCRRLMTVPGVGAVVSLTYRAGVDDDRMHSELDRQRPITEAAEQRVHFTELAGISRRHSRTHRRPCLRFP